MTFDRVLFVSRGLGNDEDALRNAMTLAQEAEFGLDVLVIVPTLPAKLLSYSQQLIDNALEAYQQMLEKVQRDLPLALRASVSSMQAHDSSSIAIKRVLQDGYGLLVKQAETKETEVGFMSVDMDLLRKCPCPVMLCRSGHQINQGKVAVAVDPNARDQVSLSFSKQLLRLSSELTTASQRATELIACWDFTLENTLANGTWLSMSTTQLGDEKREAEQESLESLKNLIEASGCKQTFHINHLEGFPFVKVPEFTELQKIDLLVMGTVARTGISSFFIGNTAENILQSLSCSLLAVKPEGFVSPVTVD